MTINIENEKLATLTELSKLLPKTNGKRVNTSTLWRWCRRGRHGITLEYLRMGAKIITTQEAMQRFFTALAEKDSNPIPLPAVKRRRMRPPSNDKRLRELEAAEAVLRRAKIIQPSKTNAREA